MDVKRLYGGYKVEQWYWKGDTGVVTDEKNVGQVAT